MERKTKNRDELIYILEVPETVMYVETIGFRSAIKTTEVVADVEFIEEEEI